MTSRRTFLGVSLGAIGAAGWAVRARAADGDLIWQDTFPQVGVGGRPANWTGTAVWLSEGHEDPGSMQVTDASTTGYSSAVSSMIPIASSQYLALSATAKSDSTGTPTVLVEEFDDSGTRVATNWLDLTDSAAQWSPHQLNFRASKTAVRLRLRVYGAGRQGADKTGTTTIDSITLREGAPPPNVVIDAWGNPVPVSDVVDIAERLSPEEFWSMLPEAPYDAATARRSVWSLPLLRRHFFSVDPGIPATVRRFHDAMPVLDHALGEEADVDDERMRKVVAADIRHRPIVTAHPWTTGTYSSTYYPRRMADHLRTDFHPAIAISDDPALLARRDELLAYLHYSQFRADGGNGFTEDHFPDWHATALASGLTTEWAGGWDYLFDWEWLDGYGYTWQLHEPDHHVGAQMASEVVRAYELTGDPADLEAARQFVWHQFPRYGFHSGVWEGRTYRWTEYGPTGPLDPNRDATDNVVALCAQAAAMVGHHTGDRRMLSLAHGMLWYCVREWTTDGRWYYDGAENPRNQRRSISHDMAVLPQLMAVIAYLTKSGVVLDTEIDVVTEAYEFYLVNYQYDPMARVRYGQLSKLAPGRAPRSSAERLVSHFTANHTTRAFRFADPQPRAAGHRGQLQVVADVLQPPAVAGDDWRVAPGRSRSVSVFAAELANGVELALPTEPGDVVRIVVDHRPAQAAELQPSIVEFVDGDGVVRRVTAAVADPGFPTTLTPENFAALVTRSTFGVGADLEGRIRPA